MTETLPDGKDYLGWMAASLDTLGARGGRPRPGCPTPGDGFDGTKTC
ncbi:hypothetical protein ACWCP6_18745 [Streptomyces sp. NPDC002004]